MNIFISERQKKEMQEQKKRDFWRCLHYRFCRWFKVNNSTDSEILAEYIFMCSVFGICIVILAFGFWLTFSGVIQ